MSFTPLTAREWLEQIDATGAQRSGFAREVLAELAELDELREETDGAAEILADIDSAAGKVQCDTDTLLGRVEMLAGQIAQCETTLGIEPKLIADEVDRLADVETGVLGVLERAGLIDGKQQLQLHEMVGLLEMFLPV